MESDDLLSSWAAYWHLSEEARASMEPVSAANPDTDSGSLPPGLPLPAAAGSNSNSPSTRAAKTIDDQLWSVEPNHRLSSFTRPRPLTVAKRAPVTSRSTQTKMPDWRDEYRSRLQTAVQANSQNKELIDECSRLCDRISALEAEKSLLQTEVRTLQAGADPAAPQKTFKDAAGGAFTAESSGDDAVVARLRLELAEALRAKGSYETRLRAAEEELARLRSKTSGDTKTIDTLSAERKTLGRRLRDREDELSAKKKLVADVQDELSVLHLQLNMLEKKHAEKISENKQLVTRYMQRIGQEADEMNQANEPFFTGKK